VVVSTDGQGNEILSIPTDENWADYEDNPESRLFTVEELRAGRIVYDENDQIDPANSKTAEQLKRENGLIPLAELKQYIANYPSRADELVHNLRAIWAEPLNTTYVMRVGYVRLNYSMKAPLNLPKFLGTKEGDPAIDLQVHVDEDSETYLGWNDDERALYKQRVARADQMRDVLQWNTFLMRVDMNTTQVSIEEAVQAGAFIDAPDERSYLGDYVYLDSNWDGITNDTASGVEGQEDASYEESANGRRLLRGVSPEGKVFDHSKKEDGSSNLIDLDYDLEQEDPGLNGVKVELLNSYGNPVNREGECVKQVSDRNTNFIPQWVKCDARTGEPERNSSGGYRLSITGAPYVYTTESDYYGNSGYFMFSDLAPGTYRLRYTFPEEYYNYSPTTTQIGIDGSKTDITVERREPNEETGEKAALIITTDNIDVEAVKYDTNAVKSESYDQLKDSIHRAYDAQMTGYKLGIAQGVTFEGYTFRDDVLADGTVEDDKMINSLMDSMGVGTAREGETLSLEDQMRGATSQLVDENTDEVTEIKEKRLEGIRINAYEYNPETGSISGAIAHDADGQTASVVTGEDGFFRFRLRAGKTYIFRTSDTVTSRLIKPTLNTWSQNALEYFKEGFTYYDSDKLVWDNDLRYVSGSSRSYPVPAVIPLQTEGPDAGKAIYDDVKNKWRGYKRYNNLAFGYIDGTKGYVGNNVWNDANYNGIQEDNEEGIGQGPDGGGVRVKMETWYYAPKTDPEYKLVEEMTEANGTLVPVYLNNAGQKTTDVTQAKGYDPDPTKSDPEHSMVWEVVDSDDYEWQLYPGASLREAWTGDGAVAGTYLFRDVKSYVIDPRDTRDLEDDYKTKRLAGYRLRIDEEDLNNLGDDYAITKRDATKNVNINGVETAGSIMDADSDLMGKPERTTVLSQAYDGESRESRGQNPDGTRSDEASAMTYYLNELGSQPENGSFEDEYVVVASIGQLSATGEHGPFSELQQDARYDIGYTMTYTNQTESPQEVVVKDPYPNGGKEGEATRFLSASAKTSDGRTVAVENSAYADKDLGTMCLFEPVTLAPGASITVETKYNVYAYKTIVHQMLVKPGTDAEVETNTVSHKVKRDLVTTIPEGGIVPVLQNKAAVEGDDMPKVWWVYDETLGKDVMKRDPEEDPAIVMPNLVDINWKTDAEGVKTQLASLGLKLNSVTFDPLSSKPAGTICAQVPSAGYKKYPNALVDLVIAGPKDAGLTNLPTPEQYTSTDEVEEGLSRMWDSVTNLASAVIPKPEEAPVPGSAECPAPPAGDSDEEYNAWLLKWRSFLKKYSGTLGFAYFDFETPGTPVTCKIDTRTWSGYTPEELDAQIQAYRPHYVVLTTDAEGYESYVKLYNGWSGYSLGVDTAVLNSNGKWTFLGNTEIASYEGFKDRYNRLWATYEPAKAKYDAAKAIYDRENNIYNKYKTDYRHYLDEKTEYESEVDYSSGKLLFTQGDNAYPTVYDMGDAARLYNWDAGLVKIPRSSISGRVWDDSFYETDENASDAAARDKAYNGLQDDGEPGLAGEALYLTQWFYVPLVDNIPAASVEGDENGVVTENNDTIVALDPATATEAQIKKAAEDAGITKAVTAVLDEDGNMVYNNRVGEDHKAATEEVERVYGVDYELASDGSGFWVRNMNFGTDKFTGTWKKTTVVERDEYDVVVGSFKQDQWSAPRSAGSYQVLGVPGVIAVKSSDMTYEPVQDTDENGNPLTDRYGNPVYKTDEEGNVITEVVDESTLGEYSFDNLPAAYTGEKGEKYLASYRVELGYTRMAEGDESSTADDEKWLLTRYHEPVRNADGSATDQDTSAIDSDAESTIGAGSGLAFTATDEVTAMDGKQHTGLRAHTGHIVVADIATDTDGAYVDQRTNALNVQRSKVTVPVSDIIEGTWTEGATEHTEFLKVNETNYVTYDWLTYRPKLDDEGNVVVDETTNKPVSEVHGGDVGEVQPPVQKITGRVFNDVDNDGINGTMAAGDTDTVVDEPVAGVQLTLERHFTLAEPASADEAAVAAGTWQVDPTWTTEEAAAAYAEDPTVGLPGDNTYGTYQAAEDATHNTVTDENGAYEFTHLKSQGWLSFDEDGNVVADGTEGAVSKRVIFGYRVRLTEADWWNRYWGTAKYLQGSTYVPTSEDYLSDSDLVHSDGYLMSGTAAGTDDEGNAVADSMEYTVLVDVATADSPKANHFQALNPDNPNQNTTDRYGANDRYGKDAVPTVLTTNAARELTNAAAGMGVATQDASEGADDALDTSFHPVLTYDLARGADRAGNDAGLRVPVQQKIAGRVFQDADYDGTLKRSRSMHNDEGEVVEASGDDLGLPGKRVILKQWYFAPVTETVTEEVDGEEIEVEKTTWQWIQNKNFGNDAYTVAENLITYETETSTDEEGNEVSTKVVAGSADTAYADGLTTIIPNATYVEGEGVSVLTDADSFGDDDTQLTVAGDYLFDRLPARYVEARLTGVPGVEGDEILGIEGVPGIEGTTNAPAVEYLAGYTVEVLGGAVDTTNTEAIPGLPATLLQTDDVDDKLNSKAISALAAQADEQNFADYTDGNYPVRMNELTVQTTDGAGTTVKATMDGKIILAAQASTQSAAEGAEATRNAATGTRATAATEAARGTQPQ
ncbi:MAG: PASTA domain-containing protein, partial [Adlercreutzia sp.]|nr:PASTA domain-containing protein [Adlercreutzia sp.]